MLTELHIEGLGVIERLEVVLGPGLTAVTGETGAGKTMVIEAIELIVGGRADTTVVRHGADQARVDGRIVDADGIEHVLSRVIPATGRSRAYIDGRPATVAELAAVTAGSIDLHGQHQHQRLLSGATQRDALDRYGRVDLVPLREARARLTELDAALAALGGDERARAREVDLLRFQVDELDAAELRNVDEDEMLDREESLLADAVAHREAGQSALATLGDEDGARDAMAAALANLDRRAPFQAESQRLADLLAELDDIVSSLRAVAEGIDENPDRLDAVRNRRQLLADLRRKYGDDLAAVVEFHRSVSERLAELESYEERAAELEQRRASALADERRAAEQVGVARRTAAPLLARAVEERLTALAMPSAQLDVVVGRSDDDHPGDQVEYRLAANPGAPPLPLVKVASGGELARVMLALRLVLSLDAAEAPGTMVFDEVDAGIGGAAAQHVADALAELASHHQVLVVTHLAQVAAVADHHVAVAKRVVEGATYATAQPLDGADRVDEVARMLAGSTTESARSHARELLR